MRTKDCKIVITQTDYDAFFRHTSYHNKNIEASYNELKTIFGPVEKSEYYKTQRNFYLIMIDENERSFRAITLYDYKERDNYKNNTIPDDETIKWHIGGNAPRDTEIARVAIEEFLERLRNGAFFKSKINLDKNENSCTQCPLKVKLNGIDVIAGIDYCFLSCDHFISINKNGIITCEK